MGKRWQGEGGRWEEIENAINEGWDWEGMGAEEGWMAESKGMWRDGNIAG